MSRPTQLHISTAALQHNLQQIRAMAPGCLVLAMVKSNAYGHGVVTVANALSTADAFGVACLEEGIQLREAGIKHPIVLLEGFFSAKELIEIVEHQFDIVVHQLEHIAILETTKLAKPVKAWFKINTGMHRLGISPEQALSAWQRLRACANVQPDIRLMTHFATADDLTNSNTERQISTFNELTHDWPGQRSLANSAGIIGWPKSHGHWIRPGGMLYGISPIIGKTGADFNLQPVMTLSTKIIAIQDLYKGAKVGYRGAWTCPQDMRIGVVAIGYGDGYPWHAKVGTPVLVNNQRVPLVGCVSMDMLTVDLRSQPQAKIGDPVVLWGAGLPVEQIALYADTIPYELVCQITSRVRRN